MKAIQRFKMCHNITETIDESITCAAESGDKEYEQTVRNDLRDEPLKMPVTTIEFDYPYDRHKSIYIGTVTTKHQLLAAIHDKMVPYMNEHPYSAPHAITDFVIEIVDILPFNESYAIAYIALGS